MISIYPFIISSTKEIKYVYKIQLTIFDVLRLGLHGRILAASTSYSLSCVVQTVTKI